MPIFLEGMRGGNPEHIKKSVVFLITEVNRQTKIPVGVLYGVLDQILDDCGVPRAAPE